MLKREIFILNVFGIKKYSEIWCVLFLRSRNRRRNGDDKIINATLYLKVCTWFLLVYLMCVCFGYNFGEILDMATKIKEVVMALFI